MKGRIGYGSVQAVKDKNAVNLVIAAEKGLERVIGLINGKFRTQKKLEQIKQNILNNRRFVKFSDTIEVRLNDSKDLGNLWLAGFSDADSSFQIKLVHCFASRGRTEVRLNYQVDQKARILLELIQNSLGGNIGYRKGQDTHYYGSTSFGSARKVIGYFDRYHLLSTKHNNYLKWRKAYIIVQDLGHLTQAGVDKITGLKNTMNRLNAELVDVV